MKRFDQIRARIRRAYQSGRASVRAARHTPADHTSGTNPRPAAQPPAEPVVAGGTTPVAPPPATVNHDDVGVPRGLRISAAWAWRLIVIGIVAWALITIIGRIQILVVPLAIALLLSALLAPAVGRLLQARFPRSLATAVVVVGGLAAVIGTLTLVVTEFIDGLPALSKSAEQGIRQIQDWLKNGPLHLSDGQLDRYIAEGQQWINENTTALTSGAVSTAATVAEVFTGSLLVLFATFFFLRDGERIWGFTLGLLPVAARHRVDDAGRASWATLVAYVRATVLVAFIDAVGIGIFLVIFDVPLAFPLTALIFLSSFIPIVGATLSGAVAVLVALVDSGWVSALVILGVVIGVQQVEGNILQPLIMGRAVALHPLAVVVAITAGVVLAGIAGALISVPLMAVLNTGIRRLVQPHPGPPAPEAVGGTEETP